jgi:hypothetical protein
MRTLKKTLALVLAVVLVLGVAVVGANAFTDDAAINYDEAVAVLTGIGVIKGMDDGSFAPAGTLTRAQAATIIARLKDAADITAASNFADTKGHWAESAIAYAAAEGIVNGVGDGNFAPDAPLTGSAWAKMLLVAAGFDAAENGMEGESWEVGVAKLVKSTKIARDVKGFDGAAEITREQACSLAFYALDVSVSGATTYVVDGFEFDNIMDAVIAAGGLTGITPKTAADSLHSQNFATLLPDNKADAFGRPARQWVYGAGAAQKVIYNEPATPAYTYTVTAAGEATLENVNKGLKLTGKAALTGTPEFLTNGAAARALAVGDTVEVYTNAAKTEAQTVVITHFDFVQVEKITDLKKSELVENDPSTKKIALSNGTTIRNAFFADFDYEEGDYILVAQNGNAVLASKAAKTVSGKVDATRGAQVRIGGQYYSVALAEAPVIGTEGTWALDNAGALAALVVINNQPTKSTDYALIYNYTAKENTTAGTINDDGYGSAGSTSYTYTVYYVTTDGTKHSAEGYKNAKGELVGLKGLELGEQATVVAFELKDGKFEIVEGEYTTASAEKVTLNKTAAVASGIYANASTVYIQGKKDETKKVFNVTTVTGYKNASLTDADITYVYNAKTKTVLYVFTAAGVKAEVAPVIVKNIAVLANATPVVTQDADKNNIYTYSVVIDGADAEIKSAAQLTIKAGQVFEYVETNGFVTEAKALTEQVEVTYVNGSQVMIGSTEYDQTGAKVYAFDEDGAISEGTLKVGQKIILVATDKNVITYAFIPYVAPVEE